MVKMSKVGEKNDGVVVIIPYYNGSQYIERSAKSVLEQTVPPAEFIVVNDGSSPDEAEKLNNIAEKMGFRVLHKENGGQGSARNYGVQNSKAKFICFLDQDDFYLKTHIATLLSGIKETDPHFGWVYADVMEADEDGNIIRSDVVVHHSRHPKRSLNDLIGGDMYVLPSASLISREAYVAVSGFDPQFTGYEDDDLFLRIYRRGYTNYFLKDPVTVWCINTNSTSFSLKMSQSRLKYIKKLCEMFPDDRDKLRYYTRDIIFPRFNDIVFAEAFRAISPTTSPHSKKMAHHADELISIMNEFMALMLAKTNLPLKAKLKMRLQSKIITKKSKGLNWLSRSTYKTIIGTRRFIKSIV